MINADLKHFFGQGLNPLSGLDYLGLSPCCLLSSTKKL